MSRSQTSLDLVNPERFDDRKQVILYCEKASQYKAQMRLRTLTYHLLFNSHPPLLLLHPYLCIYGRHPPVLLLLHPLLPLGFRQYIVQNLQKQSGHSVM